MKKLMIAAASAAMIGGAFADAQVYEWTLNVKTTESKVGTTKAACDSCAEHTAYRKQASMKVAGVYWGCECEEFLNITGPVSANEGIFFWNASKKAAFYDQENDEYLNPVFGWDFIHRIGQKATDAEAVWTLTLGNFILKGAGFGTVKGCDDATIVNKLSGNFAGSYESAAGCKRCETPSDDAWALCDCGDPVEQTAAYGTWTMKYNSSLSKKFRDSEDWSWYKWPGDTLLAIKSIIGATPTVDCETYEQALASAKAKLAAAETKLETAEAYQESVSDEALKTTITNLQAQQSTILNGEAAWVAISNMYGAANKTAFDNTGFRMGSVDTFGQYAWERSLAANDWTYNNGYTDGVTNKYNDAVNQVATKTAPVTTNFYFISINGAVPAIQKNGSKAAAAYIEEQFGKVALGSTITVTAYKSYDPDTGAGYIDSDRTISGETFDKDVVNKYNAFATQDATDLATAKLALTKLEGDLADAIAAMKAIFDQDVQIAADLVDANANWTNRKSLQVVAATQVQEASQDVVEATEEVASAQKALEKCQEQE